MPFDIGFIELCILLIVGLTVLGPDKLPVAARQLSKWFGGMRRNVNSFKSEMSRELEMDELRRQIEAQKQHMKNPLGLDELSEQQPNNDQCNKNESVVIATKSESATSSQVSKSNQQANSLN